MHLHCHLRECIKDYGPLHGFWCFPFERYNGVLGQLPNNNRSFEVQVMNRFVRESIGMSFDLLPHDSFKDDLEKYIPHGKVTGSLLETVITTNVSASTTHFPEHFISYGFLQVSFNTDESEAIRMS